MPAPLYSFASRSLFISSMLRRLACWFARFFEMDFFTLIWSISSSNRFRYLDFTMIKTNVRVTVCRPVGVLCFYLLFNKLSELLWRQAILVGKCFQAVGEPTESFAHYVWLDGMAQLYFVAIIVSMQSKCKENDPIMTGRALISHRKIAPCSSSTHRLAFFANEMVLRLFGCLSLDKSFNKLVAGWKMHGKSRNSVVIPLQLWKLVV